MTEKKFHIPTDKIREIAPSRGAGIASDLIMVKGQRVGWLYRESPSVEVDSGWRFFAGTESQKYIDQAQNFAYYDLNTIANYDLEIVPLLNAPVPAAFERDARTGEFIAVEPPDAGYIEE